MIHHVDSFQALVNTRFANGVNALCWQRMIVGDFADVVAALGPGDGVVGLEEERLRSLRLSDGGRAAVEFMLADLQLLRSHGLAPELNCIYGYPRDEVDAALPLDVYSWHADRAPIPTETCLCTYHGAPSEGLPNDEAQRRIDMPGLRAALLREFGGNGDEDAFAAHLEETCHDLHYHPLPNARPYSFGVGHLWRIAVQHPGAPVLPCIHRAPTPRPDDPPRLMLIS